MPISVYKITNIIDGKVYVGFTQRTLEERFAAHRHSAKRKPHYPLYAAMHEHGFDKFAIELIEELPLRYKDLYEREQYWIAHFNSAHPHGYNFDKTSMKRLETKEDTTATYNIYRLEPNGDLALVDRDWTSYANAREYAHTLSDQTGITHVAILIPQA